MDSTWEICPKCYGNGTITVYQTIQDNLDGKIILSNLCDLCYGKKIVPKLIEKRKGGK